MRLRPVYWPRRGASGQAPAREPLFGTPYRLPEWPAAAPRQAFDPPAPGLAFLGSAILPGAGQYLLREERWVPYVAVEAWAVVSYFAKRRDARSLEGRYKDLAWSVARRVSIGARRDTTFQYYEVLAQFDESGAFDADPRPGPVLPEQDPTKYNGVIWRRARSLYLPGGGTFPVQSVEYQRALAYYMQNAIPPGFAWAWGGSVVEQQAYVDLIEQSDDAYRTATRLLGVIVANHLVSAVDALVIARVRSAGAGSLRLRLGGGAERGPSGPEWSYWISFTW